MSGRVESRLEKILKPVRINPVMAGSIAAGLTGYFLTPIDESSINGLISLNFSLIIGFGLGNYVSGLKFYLGDRKSLRTYGFDERYGRKRMKHYCNRQAFYVACVEQGFRDEVNKLIESTPSQEKKWHCFPIV